MRLYSAVKNEQQPELAVHTLYILRQGGMPLNTFFITGASTTVTPPETLNMNIQFSFTLRSANVKIGV